MTPGLRAHKQASLTVAVPDFVPESERDGLFEIRSVLSTNPRKGHATSLLWQVCAEADREFKVLILHVQALDDQAMTQDMLKKWYSRFGFFEVQTEPCLMLRQPEPPKIARLHG